MNLAITLLTASALTGAADVRTPAALDAVRLEGQTGLLMDRALEARVLSPRARTAVYEETVNAFKTHWDDAEPGRGGWQNEYWGKTMLGVAGAIACGRDPGLKDWALDRTHAFLAACQRPNGYLSTYGREDNIGARKRGDDPHKVWNFNIWGRKYTLWGLVELYRVTGDAACLAAAEKMADHLVAQLKRLNVGIEHTGSWAGLSPMTILKPLLLLYREKPKADYLALAKHIVEVTDRSGDDRIDMNLIHDAFTDRPVYTWFGDRALYLAKAYELMSFYEGLLEYHRVTGDRRTFDAVKAFHRHLVDEELNAMFSVGMFDHFLNARVRPNGMTELCDVVHWIRLNRELYLLTGETAYLDYVEKAFYNAFLAGVSPDGSWGAHIIRSHGSRHLAAPAQCNMKYHQCCPDNMLRTFYDWSGLVATTAPDGSIDVNFYSDARVKVGDAELAFAGGYPVADAFRIVVRSARPQRLNLRVPEWSAVAQIDGTERTPRAGRVTVDVPAGERTLTVAFDMSPRLVDSAAPEEQDISFIPGQREYFFPKPYTIKFMEWRTPEMEGRARYLAASQVLRGPLVLAKGKVAGTSRAATLDAESVWGLGWRAASLAPQPRTAASAGAWGVWTLELVRGDERRFIPVTDFWSASCADDPENWFSLWF